MNSSRSGRCLVHPFLIVVVLAVLLSRLQPNAHAQTVHDFTARQQTASVEDLKQNWPGFRGYRSNGHATKANPPLTWSVKNDSNVLWKTPIAKHGMSSPVVWKDRIFLTGADDESRDVYCIDARRGMLLWKHAVSNLPDSPAGSELPRVLDETGYAAPTMVTNGRSVVAIFATGELVCLDMDGKRIWAKHLGVPNNQYGHASSLICDSELLFVQYDQKENSRLLAFKMATGKLEWRADRDEMSWSSPILIENKGRAELILTDSKYIASYESKTGKRLWRVECLSGEIASSAAHAHGLVFVANEGAAATAFDVSDQTKDPKIVWQWDGELPDAASPVANHEFLVVPTAFGVVTCLSARTGKVLWEHEFDQGFSSSPVLVGDHVYVSDLSGNTHVFKLGATFEAIGEGEVGEPVYSTPAFVGERAYIRGLSHLFCVAEGSASAQLSAPNDHDAH